MGFDDLRGDGKADAHATFFLGEEELAMMLQRPGGKARAGIVKGDCDEVSGARGRDLQEAAAGHGLDGVDEDV